MEKYDSYKFSGIDWIGEIPTHWETVKLKYLTESRKELSEDGREELLSVTESRGIVKRREFKGNDENLSRSENLTGYRLVKQGNLVNNIMLMWKRGLGVSPYDGIVSPAYSVFSFMNNCHPAYFHYLLRSEEYITEFRRNSTGVVLSRLRLYDDSFGSVFSHYPPVNEQQLISRYLDKKTKQIDSLIEKIQKKIELLKEQRTSLINQCVTKGLDPNVEMKDSGVEWVGEIPKHWGYVKLSRLVESSELGENYSTTNEDTGIPVLKMGNLGRGKIILEKLEFLKDLSDLDNLLILKKGDFLFNTRNSSDLVGKTCLWCGSLDRVTFNSNILRVHFNHLTTSQYMIFLFNSKSILDLLKITSKGTTNVSAIYFKDLIQISLPIPPLKQQNHIIDFLSPKLSQISKLIEKEDQRISIIREYRQSLISSAVTGKVRVTEDMI